MNIDFSVLLLVLVSISGGIWLLDRLWFRRRRTIDTGEPLTVEYAKAFFPVLLLVFLLRAFLFEPFRIPTASMVPALQVGDYILVNKYAYGVRLPIAGNKLFDVAAPQRGEIMVFIPPHEEQYYIKRVIGVPGDTVRYADGLLFINGEPVPTEPQGAIEVDTAIGPLPGSLSLETLDGVAYNTQHIDSVAPGRQRGTWIVPSGHYFMMGDNRDNSADSRVWGAASEQRIVGKAVAVWMHKQPGWHMPSFARNRMIR